jgi:hypothetical protein
MTEGELGSWIASHMRDSQVPQDPLARQAGKLTGTYRPDGRDGVRDEWR